MTIKMPVLRYNDFFKKKLLNKSYFFPVCKSKFKNAF
jgi:hypothetical protein